MKENINEYEKKISYSSTYSSINGVDVFWLCIIKKGYTV